jgi:hypothetical protein
MSSSAIRLSNTPRASEPTEWEAFAQGHGLDRYLKAAQCLLEEHFVLQSQPALSKVVDPESGDEWIEIAVRVLGSIPDVQAAHDRFTGAWLKTVPLEKALMIRLALALD